MLSIYAFAFSSPHREEALTWFPETKLPAPFSGGLCGRPNSMHTIAAMASPTDAGGLVRKIAAYRPTMLVGTPTFLSNVIDRAKPGDLDSLKFILVGAEKCPEAVFKRCAELAPHAVLLEGYGITECSPMVSANVPGATKPGTVGKPLPGVELLIHDLDTEKPVGPNQLGTLLVAGPTIFPGYIGYDGPSPFKEIDGKRWYATGDLAKIDDEGFIHFCVS